MSREFAHRMDRLQPSGIRRIFELMATMEDPINFSIGQAHFDPPEALVDAACRAIRAGHNRYTVTQGIAALNERILDSLVARSGVRPESCMVTSGVSGGIMLAFLCLLNPGDQILLPDPNFTMYRHLANICDADIQYYDLYPKWELDPDELAEKIGPKTKIVFLNSPSNPTGGMIDAQSMEAVVKAAEKVGAWIISDEIYDAFVYDEGFASPLGMYDRVLQLGGFSKTYGIPGWRMGYATGPADLLDKMRTLQQFSFVCAPAPFQMAVAEAAFDIDMSGWIEDYRKKRDHLVAKLHPSYELVPPGGSFYAFPKFPGAAEAKAFLAAAIEQKLLVVPGSAFSARDTHFRLSFAVTDADLERGLAVLNELAVRFA